MQSRNMRNEYCTLHSIYKVFVYIGMMAPNTGQGWVYCTAEILDQYYSHHMCEYTPGAQDINS